MTMTILIVEDDAELAHQIADYLGRHGFLTEIEGRGDRAEERILRSPPGLVILDLMLPGRDGVTVCKNVRAAYLGPILMLTARGGDADEVVGLETGADDYLAKPVRPRVLLARIRALLRRQSPVPPPPDPRLVVSDLVLDPAAREAFVHGSKLALTSAEFDMLWLLASHAGQTLSRKAIHQRLHGVDPDEFDRSIDLKISRLRQKLAEASGLRETIKTIRGIGYLYART